MPGEKVKWWLNYFNLLIFNLSLPCLCIQYPGMSVSWQRYNKGGCASLCSQICFHSLQTPGGTFLVQN